MPRLNNLVLKNYGMPINSVTDYDRVSIQTDRNIGMYISTFGSKYIFKIKYIRS